LKYETQDAGEKLELEKAHRLWSEGLAQIVRKVSRPLGEMILVEDAVYAYQNWYHNRFKLFSKATLPYANRSRDTVLRLAMLMALTRGHFGWIEEVDIRFGAGLLSSMATRIDGAVVPPTIEAQAAKDILELLPCEWSSILKELGRKYNIRLLQNAQEMLIASLQVKKRGDKMEEIPVE